MITHDQNGLCWCCVDMRTLLTRINAVALWQISMHGLELVWCGPSSVPIGCLSSYILMSVWICNISQTVLCQYKLKYSPKVINNAQLCCRNMTIPNPLRFEDDPQVHKKILNLTIHTIYTDILQRPVSSSTETNMWPSMTNPV